MLNPESSPDLLVSRVANAVRSLREERGASLSDLAGLAGVPTWTLVQLEAGRANPSLETLWAVARALGVPFSALIEPADPDVHVPRAGQGVQVGTEDATFQARLLESAQAQGGNRETRLSRHRGLTPRASAWIYKELARRAAREVATAVRRERWSNLVVRTVLALALAVICGSVGALVEGVAHPLVPASLILGSAALSGSIYWIMEKRRSPGKVEAVVLRHRALTWPSLAEARGSLVSNVRPLEHVTAGEWVIEPAIRAAVSRERRRPPRDGSHGGEGEN